MVCVIYDIENDCILESDIRTWKAAERAVTQEIIKKLASNIVDPDFAQEDFKNLYYKRWGIEVKYCQLKSRFELENFSSVNIAAILQDIYATIYLSNIMAMVKAEANENAELNKMGLKYEYKVNTSILISRMTKTMIDCFYEENIEKRTALFAKAMKNISKYLVPIRPGRSFTRKDPSRKNKFPVNRKRSM